MTDDPPPPARSSCPAAPARGVSDIIEHKDSYGWVALQAVAVDGWGGRRAVMAMPYLADGGTDPDPDALARMREETGGQVDHTNYRTIVG